MKRATPVWAVAALCVFLFCGSAGAASWTVNTFSQLASAVATANSGDVVYIAPGQYHVTSNLYCTRPNVTFRGATGNRNDVVLYGNGMNVQSGPSEGFWTANDGIQLRDLTIRDFWYHGVHVCDNPSGDLADNVILSNIRIQNCGERYIKGSGNGISHNVLVENVSFLQTEAYLPRPGHPVDPNNYIGGIDAMHTNNWTIRDCTFEGIKGATGGGRGAVFLWNGCTNALIENNKIVDCAEGIDLGNGSNPLGIYHAENAVVRNNFIGWGGGDNRPVQLGFTKDVKFYNNTIYTSAAYNRTVHIYDSAAIPTINLQLTNNIIRGSILDGSYGDAYFTNNITGTAPQADWFVGALASDLHLTDLALAAIGHGNTLADVPGDYDRQGRPYGLHQDIGADEWRLAGDVDLNYAVNFADYQVLETNFGRTGKAWGDGDFDYDGDVDFADYQALEGHFGQARDPAAVPEPATLLLAALGALALLRRRR